MDTRRIFIGEVYVNEIDNNKCVKKKVGYGVFYYDGIDYYHLRSKIKISKDPFSKVYLDASSLISYNSFSSPSFGNREKAEIVYEKCIYKISELEEKECRQKYGYYYSKEELEEIHNRDELTIYEKVKQILNDDNVKEINGENEEYLSRREYVYKVLRKTGYKSFKK